MKDLLNLSLIKSMEVLKLIVGPHATDIIGELMSASEGTIHELSQIIQPPGLLEAIVRVQMHF